jgi:hypothetical protein
MDRLFNRISALIPQFTLSDIKQSNDSRAGSSIECATAAFCLNHMPKATYIHTQRQVPDLVIKINRYFNSNDARSALRDAINLRQGQLSPQTCKGHSLYYLSVYSSMCQSGDYIIELVSAGDESQQLVIPVLKAVLYEVSFHPATSRFKMSN